MPPLLPGRHLADDSHPGIGHNLVTGVGRVDAVPDPMGCRGAAAGVVKHRLKGHQGGVVFGGETSDRLLASFQVGPEFRGLG